VCNNSPAEAISPENGSSLSVQLILVSLCNLTRMHKDVGRRDDGVEVLCVNSHRTVIGADLGGSSNYLSDNLKGQSGEGFHVNSS